MRELNNQIFAQQNLPGQIQKPFNRFKDTGIERSNSGHRFQKGETYNYRKGSEIEYPTAKGKVSLNDRSHTN